VQTHIILACLFSFVIISFQASKESPQPRAGDAKAYRSIAVDLLEDNVFTDGIFKKKSAVQGPNGEGMFFSPAYPALLAAVMAIDPVLKETITCHTSPDYTTGSCSDDFGLLLYIHIFFAALSPFFIWLAALLLTNNRSIAWISMLLSFLAKDVYGYYTSELMTENLVFPLFSGFLLVTIAAWKYKKAFLWLVSGALLGGLVLTRPSFAYLFYMYIPFLFIIGVWSQKFEGFFKIILSLVLGYFLIAGPWIIRNGITFGEYSVTKGYSSFILVQRIAYNDMTWPEFGTSFLFGLPDFGDSLARKISKEENFERFIYENKNGFYRIGNSSLREETLEKAGGINNHLSYLIKEEILGNFIKHNIVTLSIAWRGMWVGKFFSLISIPLFIGVLFYSLRRKWVEYIIYSFPAWFMLGFYAYVSVNVVRYNMILVPCLSISAAYVFYQIYEYFAKEKK